MRLCKVTGKVVATRKDDGLEGHKLLVVQDFHLRDMTPDVSYLVAVDAVGADQGDCVLVVTGSSARFASGLRDVPVDSAIIGIVDHVMLEGRTHYSVMESAGVE